MHPAPDPPRGREPMGNMTGGCKEAGRQPSNFIGLVDMFGLCPRYTVKKSLPIFSSPAGMSLTKLSLVEKMLVIPGQGEFD